MVVNLSISLTTLDDGSEVNWTPSNLSDPGEDTVDPIEGTTCVGAQVGNETFTLQKAITSTDLSNTHLYIWVLSFVGPTLATRAAGGIQIGIGDGTNQGHWYLGGNDNYTGGWKCFVVYTGKAYDRNTGTPNQAAITTLYVTFVNTTKAKTPNCFFDYIRYGNAPAIVTGGTTSDPGTFSDIASASLAQAVGTAQKEGAVITLRGPHQIGSSAAVNTVFNSKEELVVWDTQAIDSGTVSTSSFYRLVFEGNNANTSSFILGSVVGSGADSIGVQGTLITTPTQSVRWDLKLNTASFDSWSAYGSTLGNLRQVEFGKTEYLSASAVQMVDTSFGRPHYFVKNINASSLLLKNTAVNFGQTGSVTASTVVLYDTGTVDGTQITTIQGHGFSSVDDGASTTYQLQSIDFSTAEKFLDVKNNKTWNVIDPTWTVSTADQRQILFEDSTGAVNEQFTIDTSTTTAAGVAITGSSIYVYEGLLNQNLPTSGTTDALGAYTDTVLRRVFVSGSGVLSETAYGNFAIKAYSYRYNPFVASYDFNSAYEQGITLTLDTDITSADSASAITAGAGIEVVRSAPPNLLLSYNNGTVGFVNGEIVTGDASSATGVVAQVVEGDATEGKMFLVNRTATPFQALEGLTGSIAGRAESVDTGSAYTWHISGSDLSLAVIYDYIKAKTADVAIDPIFTSSIEWGEAEQSLLVYAAGQGTVFTERNSTLEEGVFITDYGAGTVNYFTDDSGSQYVPPQQFTLTLTGIKSGSEVRVYRDADGQELAGQESVDNPPGTFSYSYTYAGSAVNVTVVVHALDYVWQSFPLTLSNSDNTIPVSQQFDRNYSNP